MPVRRYFRPRAGPELTKKEREAAKAAKVSHAAAASLAPQSHDDYDRMDAAVHSGEFEDWELRDDEF